MCVNYFDAKHSLNELYAYPVTVLSVIKIVLIIAALCIISTIVAALRNTAKVNIIRIPCNSLKPFWNDELKKDSRLWYNVWLGAGIDYLLVGITFKCPCRLMLDN